MQELIPYIPTAVVIMLLIGISVKLRDYPTFSEVDTTYSRKDICEQKHKEVNEKLSCIPEVKETLKRIEIKLSQLEILIKDNGKY